jgi:hypothetical protein
MLVAKASKGTSLLNLDDGAKMKTAKGDAH